MKSPLLLACLALLPIALVSARAAETKPGSPLIITATNTQAAAERRARIETWRTERNETNRPAPPSFLGDDTKSLSIEERRARIRAKLAERRQRLAAEAAAPHTLPAVTNPPAATNPTQ